MSAPPKTVLQASPEEAEAIRNAVRRADLRTLSGDARVAGAAHVAGLVNLLSDPAVSAPIYDLPQPINEQTVAAWVRDNEAKRQRGEALLTVNLDAAGQVYSYSLFTVWPERASAEIAGAFRANLQNSGAGKAGAARSFGWMFDVLGVRLIGLTAALDNVRSARVIEAAGFTPCGERESVRLDGAVRRSRYWEMTREAWSARR